MKIRIVVGILLLFFVSSFLAAQSGQEVFQQGLAKEQLGEYENAITIYQRVVSRFSSDRELVAKSKLQMSECWMKLGDSKANDLISELIKDYKDQTDVFAQAQRLKDRLSRVSKLTDKDVLVLADFVNTTGDSIFDETLRAALSIRLEESPFLQILDDAQTRKQLAFMGRKPDERITNAVAREICVREGDKAMISGSIATVGTRFAITLQANVCENDARLAQAQAEAVDKDHVLEAVAATARDLREKLGESLSSIERLKAPPQATTVSLEALQAYAKGNRHFARGLEAAPYYSNAIELDPNFALAYMALSALYGNAGDGPRSRDYLEKAFALSDRVSERERLSISGRYFLANGELEKSIEAYASLARLYPEGGSASSAHGYLGNLYLELGELEKAVSEYQESIRLNPEGAAIAYSNLVGTYTKLDRYDEARAMAEKAIEQGQESPSLHRNILRLAYILDDAILAEREIQWFSGKPEEFQSIEEQAVNAVVHGQLRRAQEVRQLGQASRRLTGLSTVTPTPLPDEAIVETLRAQVPDLEERRRFGPVGNTEEGFQLRVSACPLIRSLRANLASTVDLERQVDQAGNLALCGEGDPLEQLLRDAAPELSIKTEWSSTRLPILRAMLELGRNQPASAVEMLQPAAAYERSSFNGAEVIQLRAYAYTQAGMPEQAAAEYQKILDHKGLFWNGLIYSPTYVWLARAARQAGDIPRAKRAYEDFFELWKDADPDVPLLLEARKEYEAL